MKLRILSIILSVVLFSQISFAQLCSVLKDARCGEYHALAVDDNNNLWVCGSGGYAMGLGDSASNILSLQRVLDGDMNTASGYVKNVNDFDAGWEHSLVATSDGFCWSFGYDSYGKLGNGPNESDSSVPVKVHGLNDDSNGLRHIVKVSAGRSGQHSLCVDSNGYVMAIR